MELVRILALSFADDGKRVKVPTSFIQLIYRNRKQNCKYDQSSSFMQVCVQGSMGEGALAGMPLQLAGTRKILEYMDWGDDGAMGTFINIGAIGETQTFKILAL